MTCADGACTRATIYSETGGPMTEEAALRTPLGDLRVLELGDALAASVCGRLFAELGAEVLRIALPSESPAAGSASNDTTEATHARVVTDALKRLVGAASLQQHAPLADLVIIGGTPRELERVGWTPAALQMLSPDAVIVTITPFGWVGPRRDDPATDLTLFHASGMARLLMGAVADPKAEPPVRAAGEQSHFIAAVAASTAVMAALVRRAETGAGAVLDISIQEALASMAARELAKPTLGIVPSSRVRRGDVLGASVVLPASDGTISVSPREAHQWRSWVEVMGSPKWALDPRFATNADRLENAGELIRLMSEWTSARTRAEIYAATQAMHVPCFPVNSPAEALQDDHLRVRGTFVPLPGHDDLMRPVPPLGLPHEVLRDTPPPSVFSSAPAWPTESTQPGLPRAGVRVLDFSWVIAGPTSTQYLASFGAEVVKIESPSRPDPGRRTALHDVLGRSKLNLGLDLKAPGAKDVVLALARQSDIVVENFARGVMDRLGIGEDDLRRVNPDIVYVSASGVGRTGPRADAVAYGTLVQCFVGFAGLNGYPGRAPSTGFAWSDPLCGMFLAFGSMLALYTQCRRRTPVHCIDHSMAEALLWTMPGTLYEAQQGWETPTLLGNRSRDFAPHGVYPTQGDDQWMAIAVTTDAHWRALCARIPTLKEQADLTLDERVDRQEEIDLAIGEWSISRDARSAARELLELGIPTSATMTTQMMFEDEHLWARQFYAPVQHDDGEVHLLPRPAWLWPDGTAVSRAAEGLGARNLHVLQNIAGMDADEIDTLSKDGALVSE